MSAVTTHTGIIKLRSNPIECKTSFLTSEKRPLSFNVIGIMKQPSVYHCRGGGVAARVGSLNPAGSGRLIGHSTKYLTVRE